MKNTQNIVLFSIILTTACVVTNMAGMDVIKHNTTKNVNNKSKKAKAKLNNAHKSQVSEKNVQISQKVKQSKKQIRGKNYSAQVQQVKEQTSGKSYLAVATTNRHLPFAELAKTSVIEVKPKKAKAKLNKVTNPQVKKNKFQASPERNKSILERQLEQAKDQLHDYNLIVDRNYSKKAALKMKDSLK